MKAAVMHKGKILSLGIFLLCQIMANDSSAIESDSVFPGIQSYVAVKKETSSLSPAKATALSSDLARAVFSLGCNIKIRHEANVSLYKTTNKEHADILNEIAHDHWLFEIEIGFPECNLPYLKKNFENINLIDEKYGCDISTDSEDYIWGKPKLVAGMSEFFLVNYLRRNNAIQSLLLNFFLCTK